jgi:hypothetical protein
MLTRTTPLADLPELLRVDDATSEAADRASSQRVTLGANVCEYVRAKGGARSRQLVGDSRQAQLAVKAVFERTFSTASLAVGSTITSRRQRPGGSVTCGSSKNRAACCRRS